MMKVKGVKEEMAQMTEKSEISPDFLWDCAYMCVYYTLCRQKPLTLARIRRFPNPDRGDDEGREGGGGAG